MKLALAGFLVVHALIHASFLSPAPPRTAGGPEWPFEMSRSWLVTSFGLDPGIVRPFGTALVVVSACLLLLAGLATLGWLVPSGWWPGLLLGGAVGSAAVLVLFFHPWLLLGFVIDAVLLWAVVAGWTPDRLGT